MKRLIAVLACCALASTAARADWSEWFGSPRPEVMAQSPDDEIPDQPGAMRPAPSKRSSGPNMLDRFSSGTKRFFGRTRQALTPKKKPAAKAKQPKDRPYSGWMPNSMRSGAVTQSPSAGSWFRRPEPPGPSSTLEDFFSKPRP